MRIEALRGRKRGCPVVRLPEPLRSRVYRYLSRLSARYGRRHGHEPSQPARALLTALAKRNVMAWAAGVDWCAWGRSMRQRKAALALVRQRRANGTMDSHIHLMVRAHQRAAERRCQAEIARATRIRTPFDYLLKD